MGRKERNWHPKFFEYMEFIVNHKNYKGLLIKRNKEGSLCWFATSKSLIGRERKKWAETKAKELGIPITAGVYAKVMLAIHPTKKKVCQVCGKEMSLYYLYPNLNFLKALKKYFDIEFSEIHSIQEIVKELMKNGFSEEQIKKFLISKFQLSHQPEQVSLEELMKSCEIKSRKGDSKMLGPGSMSNFPDRFDGFHTYNRCCRSKQDKGRSKANLRTYTKDRRAYEYWSDGNIHAANKFMKSHYFSGKSADHIGPISLGFVHDSHYLRPMTSGDNSAKRDRLSVKDIDKIMQIENLTGVYAMSWYSALLWEFIKQNYQSNHKQVKKYRDALKINVANFMEILWEISAVVPLGKCFLIKKILVPKFVYFRYSYRFNENGEIISKSIRHITGATPKEKIRLIRVAFESVKDYHSKNNRNLEVSLDKEDRIFLRKICENIKSRRNYDKCYDQLTQLIKQIQEKLIHSI